MAASEKSLTFALLDLSALTEAEKLRHKTISSDSGFKFGSGSSHQRAYEHLVGRKGVKGDLLQTKGLSADSRIFWNPTSLTGSATTKRCPFTLESSQASSPDEFFWNGAYNFQKRFKTEFGTKNNESVKLRSFEVPHGKMATISLESGYKDKHIIQPMNSQKKGLDFSFVPVSPTPGNLPILLKGQKEHPNKALSEEEKQKQNIVESGTICGDKQENAVSIKDRGQQKKERLESMTKYTHRAAQRVSFVETIDTFDPENWCHVEAMPLHRVRIPNARTSNRKQPGCSVKKMQGHISSKKRPVAAMTGRQRATSSPSNEPLEAFSTEKPEKDEESTDKVDLHDLPKPPPPSPQMLSNFNRSPSPHQLFGPSRSGSVILLEKPKTVSYLEPAGNSKPWP